MAKKIAYVVRVYGLPEGNVYVGKGGAKLAAGRSYQLMRFADEFGFDSEADALEAPVSYYFEGKAAKAEVISLQVF